MNRLTGLGGVLGIFHHFAPQGYFQPFFANASPYLVLLGQKGYLGVDIFFTLSGMVMCHVYLNTFGQLNLASYFNYLYLRFSRLVPVHYTVLFLYLVLYGFVFMALGLKANHSDKFNLPDLLLNLTLTQAWTSRDVITWNPLTWSISAEWFAYLFFPLLVPFLSGLKRQGAAVGLCLLYAVYCLVSNQLWDNAFDVINVSSLLRVGFEFIAGCLLYKTLAGHSVKASSPKASWLPITALAIFLAGLSSLPDQVHYALILAFLAGLFMNKDPLSKLLGSKTLVYMGEISYSFYLVHFLVISASFVMVKPLSHFMSAAMACNLLFIVDFVVTVVMSHCLYTCVEKPAMKFFRFQLPALVRSKAAVNAPAKG